MLNIPKCTQNMPKHQLASTIRVGADLESFFLKGSRNEKEIGKDGFGLLGFQVWIASFQQRNDHANCLSESSMKNSIFNLIRIHESELGLNLGHSHLCYSFYAPSGIFHALNDLIYEVDIGSIQWMGMLKC
ncbi:uncharacterized protein LOC143862521 isoform X1 [Tasmannia lanceolata]|uniref:uncharacterized protein LOC143862521 isoform X1 n=1 Tax=Tasmannia lanceolata TaxID=3420 RepID=UPI0040633A83